MMTSRRRGAFALLSLVFTILTLPVTAADADQPPPPQQQPPGAPPGGGGFGGGGPMMMFGNGPLGSRDAVADLITALGQVNLTPDFNLSPDQKRKLQALGADAIPRQPGCYRLMFQTTVQLPSGAKRVGMAYALYLPVGYDTSKDPCPVLIFLHGAGEAGTDGNALFAHGPAMELQR